MIRIEHLQKKFGDICAVNDLSFHVKRGELFAFLGVNGAGKSTTINIISGQLKKDGGRAEICGADIDTDIQSVKRKLGVVFQNSVLDKELSVADNLESRAALYGIRGRELRSRVDELCMILDIGRLLKRQVGKLSGGQRRRIDIARALLHRPEILIFDEATSSLDSISERYVKQTLDALARKGKTIIVIAHRLSTVKNADKIVVIDKGQVVEAGTHEELFNSDGMYHRLWKEQFDEIG